MGVDPGPFTLRQLCWMADAASRDRWQHTAALLALLANCHRNPRKTRPFTPKDFHPYELAQSRRKPLRESKPRVGVEVLKQVFVDRKPLSAPAPGA